LDNNKTIGGDPFGFDKPTRGQLVAAAMWLTLAAAAVLTDWKRYHRSDADRHPSDLRFAVKSPAVIPAQVAPIISPTSPLSAKEQEREKKRQELMHESILCYDGPSDGPFAIIGLIPCWLLFIGCAVLMLLGEVHRAVGYAMGGWTLWVWACQVAVLDPPRWT
jgi:hypothetical protein